MIDAHTYTIVVKKVRLDGDDVFRASVQELPDIEAFGNTYTEAYNLAIDAIETLQVAAEEDGRYFPPPLEVSNQFSGRVTLRMPKGLHQAIAVNAEAEGVSLNHYIVSALAYSAGATRSYFLSGNPVVNERLIGTDAGSAWTVISGVQDVLAFQTENATPSKEPWKKDVNYIQKIQIVTDDRPLTMPPKLQVVA